MSSPALHLDVGDAGRVEVDIPAGWLNGAEREALRRAFDVVRPALARAAAPPLPPRGTWPDTWREAHAERVAIALEGGAHDPEAVADSDLRAMVARGDFDPTGGPLGG